MGEPVLRGLTWGHRRAIEPLRASATAFERLTGIRVEWTSRTLGAFEHQPLVEAAAAVDLVVFDHPHAGEVARGRVTLPLDDTLAGTPDALDPACYIGRSLETYRLEDRLWALPVDGATIHAIYRPDLLDRLGFAPPADWREAVALMRRAKAAGLGAFIAGRSHHPLLTLASLMANLGAPWPTKPGTPFLLDAAALAAAIELLDEALDAGDREVSLAANAIDVHERLATDPGAAYCPAAYGYATYGEAGVWPYRLAFSGFPGPGPQAAAGAAIGGAGVGITAACRQPEAARAYLAFLGRAETQRRFADAAGQPARIEAWRDPGADKAFNGFFSGTAATMEASWVRPRFFGYPELEQDLAGLLQAHFAGAAGVAATVAAMSARAERVGTIP